MMPLGPTPWLPGSLAAPIPAARIYAWRVGIGALMLLDVLLLYLADYSALYGVHGYTSREVSDIHFQPGRAIWSVLRWLPQGPLWMAVFLAWAFACVGIIAGWRTRLCLAIAWLCSVSILYANPLMHSGGDRLRCIQLFVLMLSPLPSRSDVRMGRLACGWPAKFILFQLAVMYFFAGAYKLRNPAWQDGTAMAYILNNGTWSLVPGLFNSQHPWTREAFKFLTYGSVAWELLFPILVLVSWTRWRLGLGVGIIFHIVCAFTLQVSTFPWYSLSCYLPLLPWERWFRTADPDSLFQPTGPLPDAERRSANR